MYCTITMVPWCYMYIHCTWIKKNHGGRKGIILQVEELSEKKNHASGNGDGDVSLPPIQGVMFPGLGCGQLVQPYPP